MHKLIINSVIIFSGYKLSGKYRFIDSTLHFSVNYIVIYSTELSFNSLKKYCIKVVGNHTEHKVKLNSWLKYV